MNIAELFVRVRGDTSDISSKMRGVERSLDGVERASKSAGLQTGRLGNQFAGLAGHIAQVHPIVGNLAGVLGNFAIGAGLTVGVLGGLTAIALAYDTLTRSANEAAKAQDAAVKSLNSMLRAKSGLGTPALLAQAHGQEGRLMKRQGELQNELRANTGIPLLEQLTRGKLEDVQLELENLRNVIKSAEAILSEEIKARDAASLGEEQRRQAAAHAKVAAALAKQESDLIAYNNLMKSIYGDVSLLSLETTKTMRDRLQLERAGGSGFVLPIEDMTPGAVDISDSVKIADQQAKKINDEAARNSQMVRDAIWGSAMSLANQVVGALNIGGGGKGSNLGGAIGGTVGFAAGFAFGGPIGGAIGSTIGNIGGSLIGGLFDNKKATDINTAAIRANTQALLLNSPSGYKTASGRFSATDVKELKRVIPSYNSRGGAVASL